VRTVSCATGRAVDSPVWSDRIGTRTFVIYRGESGRWWGIRPGGSRHPQGVKWVVLSPRSRPPALRIGEFWAFRLGLCGGWWLLEDRSQPERITDQLSQLTPLPRRS